MDRKPVFKRKTQAEQRQATSRPTKSGTKAPRAKMEFGGMSTEDHLKPQMRVDKCTSHTVLASYQQQQAPAKTAYTKEIDYGSELESNFSDLSIGSGITASVSEAQIGKCKYCSRGFIMDRLEKHEEVCQKLKAKKRITFASSTQRLSGIRSEIFNQWEDTKQERFAKKPNWRIEHENFLHTIRSAREMQNYVKKGGKLSDLPPPPPTINPDYIQCPSCQRRFNQKAAERHIKFCTAKQKTMPKPRSVSAGTIAKANQGKAAGKPRTNR